ncbi:hypothetical protein [Absidia glauca]|uniref:Uncharacterized protein n=1 Tax=Absidia glauca TaxID=4829 RepID=A0A163JTP2_ABSGL|nr:hypothetical protein [Absidia glauca]
MQVLVYSCLSVAVKNSVLPRAENEGNKENMAPRIPPKPYSPAQSPLTATTQTNVGHSIPLELDGSGDRQSRHQIDTDDEVEGLTSELKRIRV